MSTPRIDETYDWLREYTAKPHPDLGRDGVVCPYMVKALRHDHVKLLPFDAKEGDEALVRLALHLRDQMVVRAEEARLDRTYLVYMMVPYGLPDQEMKAMVARVHERLKPDFVRLGYMLGDFWPTHETLGLHSPDFRPFTSPFPLLGIRHMVPADLVFFVTPDLSGEEQITYLGYFREVFEGKLNEHWAARLEDAEREARLKVDAAAARR
jgi:hypothetical protein